MQTILITGATDGLGLALARLYRAQQQRLLLIGRRAFTDTPLLGEFWPEDYGQVDLAQIDAAEQIEQWLERRGSPRLDLLIHNAGQGYHGPTEQQSGDNIAALVEVNLWAPIALTHRLLPRLRGGKVVFISSVVSTLPCPEYAVYGATKAALDGLARSLRIELQGQVTIQVIHPGATRTGLHRKSGLSPEAIDAARFPSAEVTASRIEQAIAAGSRQATIGLSNRLLRLSGLYLNGLVAAALRRRYR